MSLSRMLNALWMLCRTANSRRSLLTHPPRRTNVRDSARRFKAADCALITAIEPLEDRILLSAGALDPTFDGDGDSDGKIVTDVGQSSAAIYDIAIQPDGKIVAVGAIGTTAPNAIVARYHADGSLDTGFGTEGIKEIPFTASAIDEAHAVAVDSRGRIIVAGFATGTGGNHSDFAIARLLPNGTLDQEFGFGGIVKQDFGDERTHSNERAFSILLQADGNDQKILLVGDHIGLGPSQRLFAVARFHSDGTVDATFGEDGLATAEFFDPYNAYARSATFDSDGRIVVAGATKKPFGQYYSEDVFGVARFTPDGQLDLSFGDQGTATASLTGYDEARAVAIQSDGKIVLAGRAQAGVAAKFGLAQFTGSGQLDPTFGTAGVVTTTFPNDSGRSGASEIFDMALQGNGKIIAAGFTATQFAIARYRRDGTLDDTFGTNGRVTTDIRSSAAAYAVELQNDGKIIAAGTSSNYAPNDFALARYIGDPVPPDLIPHRPSGWLDEIVVANRPGTSHDTRITVNDTVYVDWAVRNQGNGPVSGDFGINFFIDGRLEAWSSPALEPGQDVVLTDHSLGRLTAGWHDLILHADPANQVAESDETNNRVSKQFPVFDLTRSIVTGPDAGGGPHVRVFDAATGLVRLEFMAYDPRFTGGVRVAMGDVSGDGVPDIITATGAGGGPHVRVFDGTTGQQLREPDGSIDAYSFHAYDAAFTGGVYVAVADINGDQVPDIITGAGPGGGPHVRVFDGTTGRQLREPDGSFDAYSFHAYNPAFTGGVRVATGDVSGDGVPDIITAAGPGAGPHVRVFDGTTGQQLREPDGSFDAYSFHAYNAEFTGGVYVAAADLSGDRRAEVLTGAGPGGGPHVRAFNTATGELQLHTEFHAYDPLFTGGARVGAGDVDGDGVPDILTAAGPGGGPHVRAFDGTTGDPFFEPRFSFHAYDAAFTGGVFVAGNMAPAAPLRAAEGPVAASGAAALTTQEVEAVAGAALARLEVAGASSAELDRLRSIRLGVADLSGALLGLSRPGTILIDATAAGYGWFVDSTPLRDEEFRRTATGLLDAAAAAAVGRMDLLSVVLHELRHALGHEHAGDDRDPMAPTLTPGERRVPGPDDLDTAFADDGLLGEILAPAV